MIQQTLLNLEACRSAREWASQFDNWQTLWDKCDRGDWMLWLCGKYAKGPESEARKILVAAACDCAELALKYVEKGEERPRIAIETARKWIKGEATIEEVRKAADAAYDAYAAAYATYDADAAYAAAYAAYAAADAAAYAAYDAADAAYDAAYAADAADAAYAAAYAAADAAYDAADAAYAAAYAAYAAAREETLKKCADIVRKHYPKPPINE